MELIHSGRKNDDTPPKSLLKEFLVQFEKIISQLDKGEKSKIVREWMKRTDSVGKKDCELTHLDGKITGISQGIDTDGALKLKSSNGIKKIFVGDVILS